MEQKEIFEKTRSMMVEYLRIKENEITLETNIVDDLCVDSIAMVELGFRLTEIFKVPMIEGNPDLFIMKNLVEHIYKTLHA